MAGGGVRAGFHLGATDEFGLAATERPVPFRDFHATVLHLLGIDHPRLYFETNGRLERLTGVRNQAKLVPEVIA